MLAYKIIKEFALTLLYLIGIIAGFFLIAYIGILFIGGIVLLGGHIPL